MADRMRAAMEWLATKQSEEISSDITYHRGAFSVTLPAMIGRQLLRTTDNRGNVKTERTERDFRVLPSLLIINGSVIEPEEGDKIEIVENGSTQFYELAPEIGDRPWSYDAYRTQIMIHGKQVQTKDVPALDVAE